METAADGRFLRARPGYHLSCPGTGPSSEKGEPVYIGIGTVLLIILIILLIAFVF
jgi:hypothetical protein